MKLRMIRPRIIAEGLRDLARRRPNEAEIYIGAHDDEWRNLVVEDPHSAADILEALEPETAAELLEKFGAIDVGEVFDEMNPEAAADVVEVLEMGRAASVVAEMDTDQAADLLSALDESVASDLLDAIDDATAAEVTALLDYPSDSAGGLMRTDVAVLPVGTTAGEAIEALRRLHDELRSNLMYVYVVDEMNHLLGVVSFRDLVFARPGTGLDEVMIADPIAVTVDTDREIVGELIQRYHLLAIPVIDHEGVLVGMVKVDEAIQAVQAEATEDIAAMVGAGVEESVYSPVLLSLRRRLPWILINLAGAGLIAFVISRFERVIETEVLLAALMPMVAQLGGNTGAQSLAVMIRSMAVGDLPQGRAVRAIRREVAVALLLALVMSIVSAAVVVVASGNDRVAVVMGIAVFFALVIGGFSGAAIPVVLRRAGLDPALASNIILTVAIDLVGFGGFLLIALLLL